MALDLGAVVARVILETAGFDAKYTATQRKLAMMGQTSARSAAGVRRLDTSLAGAGTAAGRAAVSLDKQAVAAKRASTASSQAASANTRGAAAADRLATAQARVSQVMARTAGQSLRARVLALQNLAAQERLAAAHSQAGSAAARQALMIARLADAEARGIAATHRYRAAQALSSASLITAGRKMSHAFTLPVVAFAAYGAKQAADFERQMMLLHTAAGIPERDLKGIASGIKSISRETATDIEKLGEGEYVIAKAAKSRGWGVADQMTILKAAAQGARAELVPMAEATDALTTVMTDYHSKASDAVSVQNQLVRASGLAKTDFATFSRSLSNVTPIAAALGISFAEVGGTLATMTQHGVSAQRATQNMRNLMFNLAGQNSVASAAMQQLGIDTVDLAKNLGRRGLTGTLAIVDKALAAHTKDGMVTVDVHKAAALATRSLDTMLGSMTGKLKTQSEGLKSGKVGIKEYTAFAKSLGGAQGASALQFLALTKNALGFSNQLRSGKGELSTSVQQYQKMLGGMTGAGVTLQSAGKYAKDNAKNVAAVGAAASHAGKDVHGFEKTQQTLSYKLSDAGNKAKLLAVAVGQKLIPFLGDVAEKGAHAFDWFDGLDSNEKAVVGWSIGIVAAIGPAMAIIGRLGRAGTGFATFAGASEAAATRVGLAMQRIGTAIGGLALAYGGTQTKGTGGAIMGALGGGLTGAAIGSFFGPIGTAVGGVVGAVGGLAAHFLMAGDDADDAGKKAEQAAMRAKQRIDEQRQAVQNLTDAINTDSNAIGANTKMQVVNDLQKSGALKLAQQAGLDPKMVADSVTGGKKAKGRLAAEVTRIGQTALQSPDGAIGTEQSRALGRLLPLLKAEGVLLEKGVQQADLYAAATGKLNLATRKVGTQAKYYKTALDEQTVSGRMNVQFIRDHVTALTGQLAKGKLTNAQWEKQIGTLQRQMAQYGFAGDKVNGYIAQFAKIPKSVATKLLADPKVARSAIGMVLRGILGLPETRDTKFTASNETTPVVNSIDNVLGRTTTPRTVPIGADPSGAFTGASAAQGAVDGVHGKTVSIVLLPDFSQIPSGGFKINAKADEAKHRKSMPANGVIFNADGSINKPSRESHIAQIARAGEWRVWAEDETGGEAYIPLALSKRARSRKIAMEAVKRLGGVAMFADGGTSSRRVGDTEYASDRAAGNARRRAKTKATDQAVQVVKTAIGNIGQSSNRQIDLDQVGYGRVDAQIRSALATLSRQIRKGLSAKATAQARTQIANLRKDAEAQLTNLRVKISGSDMDAIRKALQGTAEDVAGAFDTVITDARNANASKNTLSILSSTKDRLVKLTGDIQTAKDRLQTLTDYRTGITDTLSGDFDVSKFGSVADLVTGLTNQSGVNTGYQSKVDSITNRVKGNTALADLANSLAGKGNSAGLATLAGASDAELQQIAAAYAQYSGSLTGAGESATYLKYGQTVGGQERALASMTQMQTDLATTLQQFASVLAKVGAPNLTVKIGDKVLTQQMLSDPQFQQYMAGIITQARQSSQRGRARR